ncbi:hypothetical protein [Niabella ginsengisoli]|uniref:Uncharacterized protein n=1 Tax=Niabella ginsengisoli TaxID=522298 RepID=A0ABS9SGT3_9BACT|nr:hypothetical protein [Niabella ginsengisoli]MCH5597535.1 hypothetical protein [Niabella ginsengisoli]
MIRSVETAAEGFPNIIKVAGHEHGLQLIEDEGLQIVSGAGAKSTYAKKGSKSLFADARQGFVVVDIYEDKTADIQYYAYSDGEINAVYKHRTSYDILDSAGNDTYAELLEKDSVITSANPKYDKVNKLHRKIFGENYRKEWRRQPNFRCFI